MNLARGNNDYKNINSPSAVVLTLEKSSHVLMGYRALTVYLEANGALA